MVEALDEHCIRAYRRHGLSVHVGDTDGLSRNPLSLATSHGSRRMLGYRDTLKRN
jgi:hypothetical protein